MINWAPCPSTELFADIHNPSPSPGLYAATDLYGCIKHVLTDCPVYSAFRSTDNTNENPRFPNAPLTASKLLSLWKK